MKFEALYSSIGSITVLFSLHLLFPLCFGAANYLTEYDRLRLTQVIDSSVESPDVNVSPYAIAASKLLGHPIPDEKVKKLCKFLLDSPNSLKTLESAYHVTLGWSSLSKCTGAFPTVVLTKLFNEAIVKDGSNIQDIYHATLGLKLLSQPIKDIAKITKIIQTTLKKDDSIANLGYSFHIGSVLGPDGAFTFDRIEDAVVQADEIDGNYLQFEGGLTITSLVVSGIFSLGESLKKTPPITPEQTVKFGNYFISRRSVQTAKGVYSLANAINILTQNNFQTPLAVSLIGSGAVSIDQRKVTIKICDYFGRPIPGALNVNLEQAKRKADNQVIISNKKFVQTTDKTVYELNLLESKGEIYGVCTLFIGITGPPSAKLVGNVNVPIDIKIMAQAVVKGPLLIGTADSDQMTQPKFTEVNYPNKLGQPLEIDSHQKLSVRFSLIEKITQKPLKVHQSFVRLEHKASGQEVVFVAEMDSSNVYRLDLDIGAKVNEFGQLSGLYTAELIIGDMILTNSFIWPIADLKINLGGDDKRQSQSIFKPKPEINHLFREPEIRPPVFVSNLFTGLVFVPILILLILWIKIGVNISNFSVLSFTTLGFHLGLGSIFCLYVCFWLKLNMFETLKYLMALSLVTFLCGNKLLASIARSQKR